KFNQLSEAEQDKFMSYRIPMQAYWGYSDAEAIQFFLKYQEGVALSVGEKYHAVNEMSPLVKMTKEMLMTAGKGFHDRAEKVWGRRCDEMNRKGDNITDKNKISMFCRNMPARDSLELRKHIDNNEPGIEMKSWMDCPSCLEHSEVRLPIGAAFFWPDSDR
ncbi:MAG: hypothetical protein EBS90_12335, partial [Betaproteobacteria bacterium]|nr:hypothetical protein [Betaproteobacteria bacterium]